MALGRPSKLLAPLCLVRWAPLQDRRAAKEASAKAMGIGDQRMGARGHPTSLLSLLSFDEARASVVVCAPGNQVPRERMEVFSSDVLVVGGGGAGLRAAIAVAETQPRLRVAVISKVYPMRSHTVSAEGGAAAVIKAGGNPGGDGVRT